MFAFDTRSEQSPPESPSQSRFLTSETHASAHPFVNSKVTFFRCLHHKGMTASLDLWLLSIKRKLLSLTLDGQATCAGSASCGS